ncbi:hypothetical protein SDC9_168652 [bioreactor metagenome]|uniref:Uncharacterized protein n=1 Tax=bioreactor metagenome TaxID=1076179 RepID=A0A645GBL8_9ZZZZ
MSRLQPPFAQVLLHICGQGEKPQAVCDGRPAFRKPLGYLFLGQVVLLHKKADGCGFFNGIQIFPLQVFDERHFHHLCLIHVLYNHGDGSQPCHPGRPKPALAGNDHISVPLLPYQDGLHHPVPGNGPGQLLELAFIKFLAGLPGVCINAVYVDFPNSLLGWLLIISKQRVQSSSQAFLYCHVLPPYKSSPEGVAFSSLLRISSFASST